MLEKGEDGGRKVACRTGGEAAAPPHLELRSLRSGELSRLRAAEELED